MSRQEPVWLGLELWQDRWTQVGLSCKGQRHQGLGGDWTPGPSVGGLRDEAQVSGRSQVSPLKGRPEPFKRHRPRWLFDSLIF